MVWTTSASSSTTCGTGTWTICSLLNALLWDQSHNFFRNVLNRHLRLAVWTQPPKITILALLDQWDIHCSLYNLNHKHLSLHHHKDVCTDLSEILLVVAKNFCSSNASRPSFAAELTEHRGPYPTLQLHWTSASSLEECVATSTVCSSATCGTRVSTISDTVLHLWDRRGLLDLLSHWMIGTWCCVVMGTSATLSVYSSVGDVDRVVCSVTFQRLVMFWPPSSRTMKFSCQLKVPSFTHCGSALSRRGCSCYQL